MAVTRRARWWPWDLPGGLEILDEYLSMSVGHVQVTGRAEIATSPASPTVSSQPLWAVVGQSRFTIVVTPVCVDGGG